MYLHLRLFRGTTGLYADYYRLSIVHFWYHCGNDKFLIIIYEFGSQLCKLHLVHCNAHSVWWWTYSAQDFSLPLDSGAAARGNNIQCIFLITVRWPAIDSSLGGEERGGEEGGLHGCHLRQNIIEGEDTTVTTIEVMVVDTSEAASTHLPAN